VFLKNFIKILQTADGWLPLPNFTTSDIILIHELSMTAASMAVCNNHFKELFSSPVFCFPGFGGSIGCALIPIIISVTLLIFPIMLFIVFLFVYPFLVIRFATASVSTLVTLSATTSIVLASPMRRHFHFVAAVIASINCIMFHTLVFTPYPQSKKIN
jgi:hypothetical protein